MLPLVLFFGILGVYFGTLTVLVALISGCGCNFWSIYDGFSEVFTWVSLRTHFPYSSTCNLIEEEPSLPEVCSTEIDAKVCAPDTNPAFFNTEIYPDLTKFDSISEDEFDTKTFDDVTDYKQKKLTHRQSTEISSD
jgi:hypothetical protein